MTIKNLEKTVLFQCPITLQNQRKCMINVIISLTLLSRMKLPTFIKWTSPVSSPWLLGIVFHSYSNFNKTTCKQTVEVLIRHSSRRTICPTKRTLGIYGINTFVVYVTHIDCIVSSSNWIMIGYRAVLTI